MAEERYTKLNSDDEGVSIASTVINSVKAVLGAGILTVSWAFYFSSLWPGVISTFVMCALSAYGFYVIGICSQRTGGSTFGGIWSILFGAKWAWLPDLVVVLFCSCCIVSYLIVVGDYLPKGLAGLGVPHFDRSYYILGASLLILPLNFLEDLSLLAYTSFVGNFSVFYTTGLLLFKYLNTDSDADWEPWVVKPGIFLTIPTLAFSFNGHFGVPEMYQQLKGKSPQRWLSVTMLAFGLCLPVLLVCSVTGYFMFGSSLNLPGRSNVLMAPSMKGPEVMVAFIGMTFAVLFGVPVYTAGVRTAVNGIWIRASKSSDSPTRKKVISGVIILYTNAIALSCDNLGLVVAVNGAVCATLMMYVFPALMYMKSSKSGPCWSEKGMPVVNLLLGLIIGVAGVATTVMQASGMSDELMPQQ